MSLQIRFYFRTNSMKVVNYFTASHPPILGEFVFVFFFSFALFCFRCCLCFLFLLLLLLFFLLFSKWRTDFLLSFVYLDLREIFA